MALVQNAPGEQLLIQFGNGATPEVFTASCTINTTRSLDLTGTASSTEIADCVTPSNPAVTVRQIKSTDCKFTGAGIADAPAAWAMLQAQTAGKAINCKVIQNRTGAAGGFTGTGPFVITGLNIAGARGDMQTFTGTFEQANQVTWVQNA